MADFKEIFPGHEIYGRYFMDNCPYCGEIMSARWEHNFQQMECIACKKFVFYDEFVEWARKTITYESVMDSLTMPTSPEGLLDIASYVEPPTKKLSIPSGFNELDRMLGGLQGGELTILTGKRAEGKSSIASQLALNCVHSNAPVFFYSGELAARTFQYWLFLQAAGKGYVKGFQDEFGETRYRVDKEWAEPHIRSWLRGKLALYDNSKVVKSENNTILDRARRSHEHYGCRVFFVDNLKTARFKKDNERDYLRKQANFAADMLAFAVETNSHVFLVAHPKKDDTGDANDNVAGLSDITDLAHNVLKVKRLSDEAAMTQGYSATLEVTKNRAHGKTGTILMQFDATCKRFMPVSGNYVKTYRWEIEV